MLGSSSPEGPTPSEIGPEIRGKKPTDEEKQPNSTPIQWMDLERFGRDYGKEQRRRKPVILQLTLLGLTGEEIAQALDCSPATIQKDRQRLQAEGTLPKLEPGSRKLDEFFAIQLQEYARLYVLQRTRQESESELTELEKRTQTLLGEKLSIPSAEAHLEGAASQILEQEQLRTKNPVHQGYARLLERTFGHVSSLSVEQARCIAEQVVYSYFESLILRTSTSVAPDWTQLAMELRGRVKAYLGSEVRLPLTDRDVAEIQAKIDEALSEFQHPQTRQRAESILQNRLLVTKEARRTLEELGQEFGISRDRVRIIEAKFLHYLRHSARGLRKFTLTAGALREVELQEIATLRQRIAELGSRGIGDGSVLA